MGLSIWQILIIVAVILLLFGGRKIPGLMRDMGSGITAFRKGLKGDEESKDTAEPRAIEGDKAKPANSAAPSTAGAATKDEANKA